MQITTSPSHTIHPLNLDNYNKFTISLHHSTLFTAQNNIATTPNIQHYHRLRTSLTTYYRRGLPSGTGSAQLKQTVLTSLLCANAIVMEHCFTKANVELNKVLLHSFIHE